MKPNIALLITQALFLFCYQAFSYANEIAITFDDLPASIDSSIEEQAQINHRIVNALIKYRAPAIGFVNEGKLYRTNETQEKINLLKLWVDNGFNLGNHTYSHLSLSSLTTKQFKAEVTNGSKISKQLMQSAGRQYHYFRHPYLDTGKTFEIRSKFESFLKDRGYLITRYVNNIAIIIIVTDNIDNIVKYLNCALLKPCISINIYYLTLMIRLDLLTLVRYF